MAGRLPLQCSGTLPGRRYAICPRWCHTAFGARYQTRTGTYCLEGSRSAINLIRRNNARYFRVGLARQQKGGSNERGVEKLILWPTLILSHSFASVNRFFQVFNRNRDSFVIAWFTHSFSVHWFRTTHKANAILTSHIPRLLTFFSSALLRFSAKIRQTLNTRLSFPTVRQLLSASAATVFFYKLFTVFCHLCVVFFAGFLSFFFFSICHFFGTFSAISPSCQSICISLFTVSADMIGL